MAPATSPSVIRRIRAPVDRTSAIRASWRGRSRITAVRSRTGRAQRLGEGVEVLGRRAPDVAGALGPGPDGQLLHVDARAGVEHGAPLGHGDDGQRAAAALGGQGRPVDGVDGDVGQRGRAVADLLPVEEHRGVVLLALADDHDPVHRHARQHGPHGLDRGRRRRRACRPGPSSGWPPWPPPRSSGRGPWRGCGRGLGATSPRALTIVGRRSPACPSATASSGDTWGRGPDRRRAQRAAPGHRQRRRCEEFGAQADGGLPARRGLHGAVQRASHRRRRHHGRGAARHGGTRSSGRDNGDVA